MPWWGTSEKQRKAKAHRTPEKVLERFRHYLDACGKKAKPEELISQPAKQWLLLVLFVLLSAIPESNELIKREIPIAFLLHVSNVAGADAMVS
jgi:hypothetical protein